MLPVPKGGLQRIRIINLLLVWVFMTEKEALDEDFKMICLLIIYLKNSAGTEAFRPNRRLLGGTREFSLSAEGFHWTLRAFITYKSS